MDTVCLRTDSHGMVECGKPAPHLLTLKSLSRTFRVPVCDEHYAETNQSAAKMRVESRGRN